MITEIKAPKVWELEKFIFNPMVKHQVSPETDILRIEHEAEFTRIDFIYYPKPCYINGGWVEIAKNTFIRTVGSKQQLKLVKAINIPIAPTKHYFKSVKEFLCYTLYFPPIPKETAFIDIIEKEVPDDNTWFNFYGVSMETIRKEKLITGN